MSKATKSKVIKLAADDGLVCRFEGDLVQLGQERNGVYMPLYGGAGWMTYEDAVHLFTGWQD